MKKILLLMCVTLSVHSQISAQGYADSPWPMYGGDPANTFRVQLYNAPSPTNTIKWKYETGGFVMGPSIGSDGTIYAVSSDGLYAVNPDGSLKWKFDTGGYSVYTTPAIAKDGTLFFRSSGNNTLYAVNPDGSLKWTKTIPGGPPPKIDEDGTIYVASTNDPSDRNLYALNPDGSVKWTYAPSPKVGGAVAISPNGSIFFQSGNSLYALYSDGALHWKTGDLYICEVPAVDYSRKVVYARSRFSLYAFDLNSIFQWEYSLMDAVQKGQGVDNFKSPPSLGRDGTIYIGSEEYLYAFNPDGTVKWRFATKGWVEEAAVVGSDGCLYFCTSNPLGNAFLYAVNSDSTLRWEYEIDSNYPTDSEVAIGRDGTLYVGMSDHYLYAFAPEGQTTIDEEPKPEALPTITACPNPFNAMTTISFTLPKQCHASLTVYNLAGQMVRTLADGPIAAGNHTAVWNGRNDDGSTVAAGVYVTRLTAEGTVATGKMVLVK